MRERVNIHKHLISYSNRIYFSICITLSHIQQICSRQLWKHTRKKLKTLFKWKYNNWIELKTWWQKEKLLVLSNFFFCQHDFKKLSAPEASESVYMRERVRTIEYNSTASNLQKSFDTSWKHCGKMSYCSELGISPFTTMFSCLSYY